MSASRFRLATLVLLALPAFAACVLTDDPCEGVTCDPDRLCAVIDNKTQCLCADPAVDVNGECVVPTEE